MRTRAFGYREAPGRVAHLINESSVRVSQVKCLYELQARSARRRFVYSIGFQAAAIGDDHKRTRCHGKSLAARARAHVCYLYKYNRWPLQHRACSKPVCSAHEKRIV